VDDDLMRVREMSAVEDPRADVEVLYWVGCAAVADERVGSVARAMVRIMNRAGVRFAILGSEERCTGDPARRTGNDLQFDALARTNIETLARYGVERVVTHCPHCFHTLRNEYPELGGRYDVQHHTEFLRELLASGRLRVTEPLAESITFHDPCYLSRHNGITEAPRDVLHQIGVAPREMRRTRERSFCCGAGGGHAFFEERTGGQINRNRAEEAVATGARTICTACPFCLPMMEDGLRAADPAGAVRVRDLAELVDEALSRG
jgi:Fe-S oxidoreductase